MRHVEQEALEEEHEGHPLVVCVVPGLLAAQVVGHSRVGHLRSDDGPVLLWQRERRRDPTVRVYDVSGDGAVRDAGDRISCITQTQEMLIRVV